MTTSRTTGTTILSGAGVATASVSTASEPKSTPAETIGPRSASPAIAFRSRGDAGNTLRWLFLDPADRRIQVLEHEREADRCDPYGHEDDDRKRLLPSLPELRLVRLRLLHRLQHHARLDGETGIPLVGGDVGGERGAAARGERLRARGRVGEGCDADDRQC